MFSAALKKSENRSTLFFDALSNKQKFIEIGLDLNFKIILQEENVGKKITFTLTKNKGCNLHEPWYT